MKGWKAIRKGSRNTPIGERRGWMKRKGEKKKKRVLSWLGNEWDDPFERAFIALDLYDKGMLYVLRERSFGDRFKQRVDHSSFLFTRQSPSDPKEVSLYHYLLYLTGILGEPNECFSVFLAKDPQPIVTPGDYVAALRLVTILLHENHDYIFKIDALLKRLIEYEKWNIMNSEYVVRFKAHNLKSMNLKEYLHYNTSNMQFYLTPEPIYPTTTQYEWKVKGNAYNAKASVRYKSQMQKMRQGGR